MLAEKEDLFRMMKMLEKLNRDHRLVISASIDAYRRDELMQEAEAGLRDLQEA